MANKPSQISQSKNKSLLNAYLTAFLGGFCVMVVEVIASRLIARYLGASVYTWTSVIGVVLAGIAMGNFIGGWIADRYEAKKSLARLFFAAAFACMLTPVLNRLMGNCLFLMIFPGRCGWPDMCGVFFLPRCSWEISRSVAIWALDQGAKPEKRSKYIAWGSMEVFWHIVTDFSLCVHRYTEVI